jgi:predicted TIM-barrel fold metal-dependent hydrolase
MMIIDAHTHVGADIYAGQWTGEDAIADADRYAEIQRESGVDKGFAFTMAGLVTDPAPANDLLARARDRHPDVIMPWGTVDPYWEEKKLRREMRRCIKELGFFGFKLHPWLQGFSLTVPGMEVVAEECADLDVPIVFHDGTPTYCTALQVAYFARAHPQVQVLSGHAGLADQWPDVIEPARELPNYWICLCGPNQLGLQTLYDELGPDKLLFGSDGGCMHPATTVFHLRRIRALLAPAGDIEKILALNALRLLKLEQP